MEKEPTLENLLNQIEGYSSKKNEYEGMQTRLGTDQGPEVLNPRLIGDLSGRASRLGTLGRIRKLIAEELIPDVEGKLTGAASVIEEAVNNKIREQIGQGAQYLTTEELELVKPTELLDLAREYRRGLITFDQYVSEIKQVLGGEPQTYTAQAQLLLIETQEISASKLALLGNNQVEKDGVKIELTDREYAVLTVLYKNIDLEYIAGNLSKEAFNNPNAEETRLRVTVRSLKEKLGSDLIVSKQAGPKSSHKLTNIEKVKTDQEKVETWIAEIQKQVDNGILTNRNALERVVREAVVFGIEFNLPAVVEDSQLVELKPEDIEFDAEESAVLARLIIARTKDKKYPVDGRTFEFHLTDGEKEAIDKLLAGWEGSIENPEQTRNSVLTKLEVLFTAENADDLVLKFGGDLRELLVGLFYMDRRVTPSYLLDYLKKDLDLNPRSPKFSSDIIDWIKKLIRAELGEELPKPAPKPVIVIQHPEEAAVLATNEPVVTDAKKSRRKPINLPARTFAQQFTLEGLVIEKVRLRPKQVLEILYEAYLANPDNLIPMGALLEVIWPGLDTARENLSVNMADLRKVLKVTERWDWENLRLEGRGGESLYRLIKLVEDQAKSASVETLVTEDVVDKVTDVVMEVESVVPAPVVPTEPEITPPPIAPHESQKDQEWKEKIDKDIAAIIDKLHLENWTDHMRSNAMTNAFRQSGVGFVVKDKMMEPAIRKEFISKDWAIDVRGMVEYSRETAIMLAYLNDNRKWQNMRNDQKYYLIASVERQFKVWEAKNRKGNGH